MKEFEITNRKIEDLIMGLQAISRPHPQTTTDGKTVTRDFAIPPKAKTLLLRNYNVLKAAFDAREQERLDLIAVYIPKGEPNHTHEEVAEFKKEGEKLLRRTVKLKLHQVWLHWEKTDKPDAIDLTKAEIPFHMLGDLLDIILIEPDAGNSESKPA